MVAIQVEDLYKLHNNGINSIYVHCEHTYAVFYADKTGHGNYQLSDLLVTSSRFRNSLFGQMSFLVPHRRHHPEACIWYGREEVLAESE
jgi:hypothetical protein